MIQDRSRARQSAEQSNEKLLLLERDARLGKKLLELIDHEDQLGLLEQEKTAVPASCFGQSRQRILEQEAGIVRRRTQTRGEFGR